MIIILLLVDQQFNIFPIVIIVIDISTKDDNIFTVGNFNFSKIYGLYS